MIKPLVTYYDVQTNLYDSPMMFDSVGIAANAVRRNIRDMFIKGDVTLDALKDTQLRLVGFFDTEQGEFIAAVDDGVVDFEFMNPIRLSNFVTDLIGDTENDY